MIKAFTGIFFVLSAMGAEAQKYSSEKGKIIFFSDAAVEDIEAVNTLVGSLYNISTGDLVYIIKIKDFVFDKSLMREHFNEKYMESEKFPKSTFTGKIVGFKEGIAGVQNVTADGSLTIHGVTKKIQIPGTIEAKDGKLIMKSQFVVKLSDYNIKIPTLIWQNIAEEVKVTIDLTYKSL